MERQSFGSGGYRRLTSTKLSAHIAFSSSIKVITITGLIILGIIVDLGGGPNHDRIGFRYWKNPGPFTDFYGPGAKGQFLGTCSVATQAMFAYVGTEAVAVRFLTKPLFSRA